MIRTDFYSVRYTGSRELRSEDDFRKFRLRAFEALRGRKGFSHVVYGHHADDLFETRLMRLIRGTGPGGWRAMEMVSPRALRPLLTEARTEIEAYANRKRLRWIEDPTNTENHYFRNWLRHTWLPQLETKRPGSRRSLARSLEVMAEAADVLTARTERMRESQSFDRAEFTRQDLRGRRQMIANCLRETGHPFGHSHVEEIRKRLEVSTKRLEFRILGLVFKVNAQQVDVQRAAEANAESQTSRVRVRARSRNSL